MDKVILDKNLLCLAATSAEAAATISHCRESDAISLILSRDGDPVPVLADKPLHSRFNPVKEGERLSQQYSKGGMILAYGLGGAYHLLPLLNNKELSSLIIIENDPSIVKAILGLMDMSPLFLDKRVRLWISENPEDFKNTLLAKYVPVLSGDLQSISLRTRIERNPDFYHKLASVVQESISAITDDYTVQTHFGKKWFVNTLNNLEASEETTVTLKPVHKVQITAAGPGLEKQMAHLIGHREDSTLIATDTSLPVLLENGLTPDMVISIDCQHISYHHFMKGYPENIPLVLDLASPPFLTRIAKNCFFFTSDHPFSNYVRKNFRQFPRIDTSGGNVTHAALSLAESLGAKHISLYGADFSYPYGKPYARGSYVFPYFQKSSCRISGIENQVMDFVLHNKTLNKEIFEGGFRYISKPMIHYRTSLEKKADSMSAQIENIRADGVQLKFSGIKPKPGNEFKMMSAGESYQSRKEFLKEFAREIDDMPELKGNLNEFLDSLNKNQKEILLSILPAAAHFRKKCDSGTTALNQARSWTKDLLYRKTENY
jgi:6-hydroxymethylpterin diphosphokinase MptE-like